MIEDAPPVDTTAPTIIKATPANMARKVSVIQPLTVVFDEDLDPATVNATSVVLTYDNVEHRYYRQDNQFYRNLGPGMTKQLVPGTVTFDAVSRTLRFEPKAPLPYGKRFTFTLTALKDAAGNELTTSLSFMTFVNFQYRDRVYNSQLQPVPYLERPVDANGFQDAHVVRNGFGMDMMWHSPDDTYSEHHDLTFDADGRLQAEFFMLEVGTDGNLADDTIDEAFTYSYDTNKQPFEVIYTQDPGVNMTYGNDDDVITYLLVYRYAAGQPTNFTWYSGSGTVDMMWRTADDTCVILWDFSYDPTGRRTREVFTGCGTDGLPATPDDDISYYYEHQYDANHALTRTALRSDFGGNMTWLDDDDGYGELTKNTVDANGLVTVSARYTNSGMDAIWDNGDEVPTSLTRYHYDANKQLIETTSYDSGALPAQTDDVIRSYTRYTYDALGNRVTSKTYDLGPDAQPYTGDERVSLIVDYDTMH